MPVYHSKVAIFGPLQNGKPTYQLSAVQVPAGHVTMPSGVQAVHDRFVTDPLTIGVVQQLGVHEKNRPFVRYGMVMKAGSPRLGDLHVVQRGVDADHMEPLASEEIFCEDTFDAAQGDLELVGPPIDFVTRFRNLKGSPEDVMLGLSYLEVVALAAFLNNASITETANARLGTFDIMSESELLHAAANGQLFGGACYLTGMPSYESNWTRDLFHPAQLQSDDPHLAQRVTRSGYFYDNDGNPLPVYHRNAQWAGNKFPVESNDGYMARLVIRPLP